jgi:hypothetical protein
MQALWHALCLDFIVGLHKPPHLKKFGEVHKFVYFFSQHCLIIEFESFELKTQYWRQFNKLLPFFGFYLITTKLTKILVIRIEFLCLQIPLNSLLHLTILDPLKHILDRQRQIQKSFHPLTKMPILTLHKRTKRPLIQPLNPLLITLPLPRLLNRPKQHPTELLHIVLLERVGFGPLEGLDERAGAGCVLLAQLQLQEELL